MRKPKQLSFNSIKEGFDMLPTAACFFDSAGSIVLCNRQMYQLSRYLLDSDMQYLGEVTDRYGESYIQLTAADVT